MKKGRKVYKHQIVKVGILQISNNNLIPMNKHIRLFFFVILLFHLQYIKCLFSQYMTLIVNF